MRRPRLLPAASRHMKRLPLDDGTVIALASDAITAASLARARRQLAASEKKVRAAITHLKKTLRLCAYQPRRTLWRKKRPRLRARAPNSTASPRVKSFSSYPQSAVGYGIV